MTALQNQYWQTMETRRHNQQDERINQQNADTNAYNATINKQNADTNRYNADTNRLNYGVNVRNAESNAKQAQAASTNAAVNQQLMASNKAKNYYSALESANKASVISIEAAAQMGTLGTAGFKTKSQGMSSMQHQLEQEIIKNQGYKPGETKVPQYTWADKTINGRPPVPTYNYQSMVASKKKKGK